MHEPQTSLIFRIASPGGLCHHPHRGIAAGQQLNCQKEKLSLRIGKSTVNSKSAFAKVGQKSSVFVRMYQQR
jgi:hypothetical protein